MQYTVCVAKDMMNVPTQLYPAVTSVTIIFLLNLIKCSTLRETFQPKMHIQYVT